MLEDLSDTLVNTHYVVEYELISTGCIKLTTRWKLIVLCIIFVLTASFWLIKRTGLLMTSEVHTDP